MNQKDSLVSDMWSIQQTKGIEKEQYLQIFQWRVRLSILIWQHLQVVFIEIGSIKPKSFQKIVQIIAQIIDQKVVQKVVLKIVKKIVQIVFQIIFQNIDQIVVQKIL